MRITIGRLTTFCCLLLAQCGFSGYAAAQINSFDDFESYALYVGPGDEGLIGGGWTAYATVFADWPGCSSFSYGYGAFATPNKDEGFSNITPGSSGQALNVFSDYANADHGNSRCLETSVFQERTLTAADADSYTFSFDTQINDSLGADVETFAFIKLLDPGAGFAQVSFDSVSTVSAGSKSISKTLLAADAGLILQWGFTTKASLFLPSGRVYDNALFAPTGSAVPGARPFDPNTVPIPAWAVLFMAGLIAYAGGKKLRARKDT